MKTNQIKGKQKNTNNKIIYHLIFSVNVHLTMHNIYVGGPGA